VAACATRPERGGASLTEAKRRAGGAPPAREGGGTRTRPAGLRFRVSGEGYELAKRQASERTIQTATFATACERGPRL
jgi:hypothetical protein